MRKLRIGVVGLNHGHIHGMVQGLLGTGETEIACGYAAEPDLRARFDEIHGTVPWKDAAGAVFEARDVDLVCTASINGDRGRVILDALAAGKAVFVDKPMLTRLDELEEVGRAVESGDGLVFVFFGERLSQTVDVQVKRCLDEGRIGDLVYFAGWGPHKLGVASRPGWMFRKESYGGILCDIASHQFELFAYSTGGHIVQGASRVGNYSVPEHPEFEDFGDATFCDDKGTAGYIRVDWLTPDAMPVFGDVRQLLVGTDGQIEIRRYVDLAREEPAPAVFITTRNAPPRQMEIERPPTPFFAELVRDVRDGVNRCMPHDRAFDATRAALLHERDAARVGRMQG
jgi:predicted dehydrogenase